MAQNYPTPASVKSMNPDTWLQCVVSEGQFSDEYAVRARTADGTEFSLFVPQEFVEVDHPPTEQAALPAVVRVDVLDEQQDLVLVRLPRQTLENGRSVTVSRAQLETRPARQEA